MPIFDLHEVTVDTGKNVDALVPEAAECATCVRAPLLRHRSSHGKLTTSREVKTVPGVPLQAPKWQIHFFESRGVSEHLQR